MNLHLSRRNAVRMLSFSLALLLTLSVLSYTNLKRAKTAERQLEYHYLKSVDDLSNYLENIETTLTKVIYTGTPARMSTLTSSLQRESGYAKECIATLPISELHLEKTYKFLSQLGDYAVSLSHKMTRGETLTTEERENLRQMKHYTTNFLQQVFATQDGIRTGSLSFSEVKNKSVSAAAEKTAAFSDGFTETEESFTDYPSLIYDGPFSDHILEKEPLLLKNAKTVSQEEAKQIAANALSLSVSSLSVDTDESGKMPSYCFTSEKGNAAVTKQGGFLSYLIQNRSVSEETCSVEECSQSANSFLQSIGVTDMKQTYYEISQNCVTFNFAAQVDQVTCYTDLIKVTVAMDNREILGYDGRGYLTNHTTRTDLTPTLSQEEAAKSLSPMLTVESVHLALIPTSGQKEVLCYEFKTTSPSEDHVLVYVNAKTGAEENLLILSVSDNGFLTL